MIALFAVTDAGRRAATELAPALGGRVHALDDLTALWPALDAAVFCLATGATVRLIAPLLGDKRTDPGVVCVDEARRFAVALTGGHEGGANALAERVGTLLGAQPVVTTASDAAGSTGLDELARALGGGSSTATRPRPAPPRWTARRRWRTRWASRCRPCRRPGRPPATRSR